MGDFFIKAKGEESGPYTELQLRSMWNSGMLTSDTLFREANSENWEPLASLLESVRNDADRTVSLEAKRQATTTSLAVWSLVLGTISILGGVILTGIPAIICGRRALKDISASGGRLEGVGLATGGIATGTIGIVLFLIGVIAGITILGNKTENAKALHIGGQSQTKGASEVCGRNLMLFDSAANQWRKDNNKDDSSFPSWNEVASYIVRPEFSTLKCPERGVYSFKPAAGGRIRVPVCSVPGHELPMARIFYPDLYPEK